MKTAVGTFLLLLVINGVISVEWKHSAVLDNNFLVLWTPDEKDVTFEIQVKTLGYVGLGFTKDDGRAGADMVIGWVDNNGQVHLQKLPTSLYTVPMLLISVSDRPPDVSYKMESSRTGRTGYRKAIFHDEYREGRLRVVSRHITNWETLLHVDGIDGEEIVGLQIASVSRVRNFSGRIVARSFHNACRAPRNALYDAGSGDCGESGGRRGGGEKRRERENDWHLQREREAFSL
ncbi:MOXD1 like protein 2 [Trachymyrmex cornetzi]|uniref:MOXD1 like protein 2 n=1 Tax=Trachymyrmex cornetzi TaxID=471704 RepID=A0A195E2Q8_9HYME|nr:MOXD1 like protein 2 [Trachymyrmex cornetzi]